MPCTLRWWTTVIRKPFGFQLGYFKQPPLSVCALFVGSFFTQNQSVHGSSASSQGRQSGRDTKQIFNKLILMSLVKLHGEPGPQKRHAQQLNEWPHHERWLGRMGRKANKNWARRSDSNGRNSFLSDAQWSNSQSTNNHAQATKNTPGPPGQKKRWWQRKVRRKKKKKQDKFGKWSNDFFSEELFLLLVPHLIQFSVEDP